VVYALTLNHGTSLRGLPLAAQAANWTSLSLPGHPLLKLAIMPWKFIPVLWQPTALNLMSALTAALTIVLLCRSVQLLPYDRLRIQRQLVFNSTGLFNRPDAWLPVVLAAVVGGLELGYWQEATSASGEMLDLLLMALPSWCLLEYRLHRRNRWLNLSAVAWGIGMAENWEMQATLPLYVAAVIGLVGLRFLHYRVFGRLLGFMLVALLGVWLLALSGDYLFHLAGAPLPPKSGNAPNSLLLAWLTFAMHHRQFALSMLFYYLAWLPMLLKIKPSGVYQTAQQSHVQLFVFQLIYAICLFAGMWLAFEPLMGPQAVLAQKFNLVRPFLSFVYLNALGVGYYAGHFLLIYGADLEAARKHDPKFRRPAFMADWLRRLLPPVLRLLPILMAAALLTHNLPALREPNLAPLTQYGDLIRKSLPPTGGIVISDDPQRLAALQAALSRYADRNQWMLVDSTLLSLPAYRSSLEKIKPGGWLPAGSNHNLSPPEIAKLISQLATTNQLYYLHPSFGRFPEGLTAEPHGLVFKLTRSGTNFPAAAVLAENERFWDQAAAAVLDSEVKYIATPPPRPLGRHPIRWRLIALAPTQSHQSQLLGIWYSVALSDWGTCLARAGLADAARRRFEQAQRLYPDNRAAYLQLHNQTNLANVDVSIPIEKCDHMNDLNRVNPQPFVQDIISQRLNTFMDNPGT